MKRSASVLALLFFLSLVLPAFSISLVSAAEDSPELWSKTYGGEVPDSTASVLEAKDGGYVVANSIDLGSENPPSGASIFKTDMFGNTEWTVEYQGTNQPSFHPLKIL